MILSIGLVFYENRKTNEFFRENCLPKDCNTCEESLLATEIRIVGLMLVQTGRW